MSFIKDSNSLRAKLHISHISKPVLVGVVVIAVLLTGVILFNVNSLPFKDAVIIEAKDSNFISSQDESDNDDLAISDENSENKTQETYFVHVEGSVKSPGMYELPSGSRVYDAIQAAGGFSEKAQKQSVNLARLITDGEQIIVGSVSDEKTVASHTSSGSTSISKQNTLVNINTASVEELCSLSGIGEATANKIIADREENGSFKSKEDITRVSGIGEKKYEAIKEFITV